MGSYLSSPAARAYLEPSKTFARTSFWVGLGLWAFGFAGNVIHDEILANIRRKANSGIHKKDDGEKTQNGQRKQHYAIPRGLLYEYISFPNYFCEWIEWFGFALAAAPLPRTPYPATYFLPELTDTRNQKCAHEPLQPSDFDDASSCDCWPVANKTPPSAGVRFVGSHFSPILSVLSVL